MNGVGHTPLKDKNGRKVDLYPAAALEDIPAEVLEAYPDYEERVCEGCNKTVVVHPPTFKKAKEGSEERGSILVVWCMGCHESLADVARHGYEHRPGQAVS